MAISDPQAYADLLTSQALCRVATTNRNGPHVTPVGFVFDGECIWIATQIKTQRFVDLQRNPRVAVLIEPGERGAFEGYVEIIGDAEVVGAVPCMGNDPETAAAEALWLERIGFALDLVHDGLHAWVRVVPAKILQVTSVVAGHDDAAYLDESRRVIDSRDA